MSAAAFACHSRHCLLFFIFDRKNVSQLSSQFSVPYNPIWKIDHRKLRLQQQHHHHINRMHRSQLCNTQTHTGGCTHANTDTFDALTASQAHAGYTNSNYWTVIHIWPLTTDSTLNSFSFRDSTGPSQPIIIVCAGLFIIICRKVDKLQNGKLTLVPAAALYTRNYRKIPSNTRRGQMSAFALQR